MKLFEPVKPALASPSKNLDDLLKRVELEKTGGVAVEYKIDGFRCQAHHDDETAFYSRQLNQLSEDAYPEIVQGIGQLGLENAILDGELVAYDPKTNELVSFQKTMTRKRSKFNSNSLPLKYLVFDALIIDGEEIVEKPYHERREILESSVTWNATVELVGVRYAKTASDVKKFYDEALEKGFEGIMAKKIDAPYDVGKRNNNWVKLKPTTTVDCVMMGWYFGNGVREEWSLDGEHGLGAFLLGVRNPETGKYETLVKAGTGLNKEWSIELLEKVEPLECEQMPKEYAVPKGLTPDRWLAPKYVMELRGQQITQSPVHSCGYSLRFPTLLHLREDRKAKDSTTVSEVEQMFAG